MNERDRREHSNSFGRYSLNFHHHLSDFACLFLSLYFSNDSIYSIISLSLKLYKILDGRWVTQLINVFCCLLCCFVLWVTFVCRFTQLNQSNCCCSSCCCCWKKRVKWKSKIRINKFPFHPNVQIHLIYFTHSFAFFLSHIRKVKLYIHLIYEFAKYSKVIDSICCPIIY